MSAGVGHRIPRLSHHEKWLLLLPVACGISGFIDNYFRLRSVAYRTSGFRFLLLIVQWATVAGTLTWSTARQKRTLADYGFTFRRGGLGSLAALLAVHAYLVMTGKMALSSPEGFVWMVVAVSAFMEEIIFRVIAIDAFVLLLDRVKGKGFWAILASSALFTACHLPSKSPMQLQGIFVSSLIMGYVYYKTRSVLLPGWYHAASNAGFAGGILAVAIYCTAAATDRITRGGNESTQLSRITPANT